jgi:hypothetical protein
VRSSSRSYDRGLQARLWACSEQATGLDATVAAVAGRD